MPIKHVNFAQQQRAEAADLNAIGDLELTNLSTALAALFGPGASKVARGGNVHPTAPASKNIIVEPLAAFSSLGLPIILETFATKAIADNASGNPRIDLVSIGVALVNGDSESRKFWNPASETSFDQATNTRTTLVVAVTVTQGTPGALPEAPPTPAGHIALAHVAVENGMTSITADDITLVGASYVEPVKVKSWLWNPDYGVTGVDAILAVPYATPDLMVLDIPAYRTAILIAQIYVKCRLGGAPVDEVHPYKFALTSTDETPFTSTVGRAMLFHNVAARPESDALTIIGVVPGGQGPLKIRLGISHHLGPNPVSPLSLNGESAAGEPLFNRLVALVP